MNFWNSDKYLADVCMLYVQHSLIPMWSMCVKTIKAHETSGDTYVHEDRRGLSSADPKRSGRLITGNGMKLSERRDVGCRMSGWV
jgi:hypothetical protein